jgi:plastocyanin
MICNSDAIANNLRFCEAIVWETTGYGNNERMMLAMCDRGLRQSRIGAVRIILMGLFLCTRAVADDPDQIKVTLRDHRFDPAEIQVRVGKPTILFLINEDAAAEEFDSTALRTEKVIAAGHHATIRLRPLGPGRYPFMGEFHPDTAQGVVIAE